MSTSNLNLPLPGSRSHDDVMMAYVRIATRNREKDPRRVNRRYLADNRIDVASRLWHTLAHAHSATPSAVSAFLAVEAA